MLSASPRRYSRHHVWAEPDGDLLVLGLSARALEGLGEISSFSFRVRPGDELEAGACFGALESAKAEVELFTPIGGTVTRVHETLEVCPDPIEGDCYGEGWMLALRPHDPAELAALLDAEAYSELLKTGSLRA